MKKIISAALVACLLLPTGAFASATGNGSEDVDAQLTARNQAFTEYLSENLTDEAAYDPDVRAEIIADLFASQPQYASAQNSPEGSADASQQELETVDVYTSETKTSETTTEGVEMYITYYGDGSFVLGTNTYTRNEDPDSEEVIAARKKAVNLL